MKRQQRQEPLGEFKAPGLEELVRYKRKRIPQATDKGSHRSKLNYTRLLCEFREEMNLPPLENVND